MVGLLQALPGTQLYRRLEREGRLISDANGNNIDCNLSFVPRMSAQRVLEEHNFSAPAESDCIPQLLIGAQKDDGLGSVFVPLECSTI